MLMQNVLQDSPHKMISKNYEKAELKVIPLSLNDVLTTSSVVTTEEPLPTEPPTQAPTSGGVEVGGGGSGDITFNYEDFFK